jgi:hypothetical protein
LWLVVSFGCISLSRCTTVSSLCISTEGRTFTRSAHRSREPNERLPPHISSQIRPATERPLLAEPGSHPTVSLRLGIIRSWGASHPARERLVHDALQSCISLSHCAAVTRYISIYRCISFSRCVSLHLALSCSARTGALGLSAHHGQITGSITGVARMAQYPRLVGTQTRTLTPPRCGAWGYSPDAVPESLW